jgi:hypothetical protein
MGHAPTPSSIISPPGAAAPPVAVDLSPGALAFSALSAPASAPEPYLPEWAATAQAPSVVMGNGMPVELLQQLDELEQWSIANKNDARIDTIAFWSLKIPAILGSAGAGLLAHFELTYVSLILGTIASACVIIDGVNPRGTLRNIHLRAHHDLRLLSTSMVAQWRSRDSKTDDDATARQIIRNAEKQRQHIAAYIRDAETALRPKI